MDDIKKIAEDVLTMAMDGHMPNSYWYSDSRITRAIAILDITPDEAYLWAERNCVSGRGN